MFVLQSVKSKNKSFTLLEIVFTIVIIGILLAIFLPAMSSIKLAAQKVKDQSNLKTIAKGWYECTINQGITVSQRSGTTYGGGFTYSLAGLRPDGKVDPSKSILNDPDIYISPGDKYASKPQKTYLLRSSGPNDGSNVAEWALWENATQDLVSGTCYLFSYCLVGNLSASVSLSTTPVAFTRGLKTDGTWDEKYGLYGSKGGYVVFCDGHVTWFDGSKPAQFLHWDGQRYTKNIFEAIPNTATIGCGNLNKASTTLPNLVIWGNGIGGN
jgi:prepilin-type processing-associated H-X9-DG protein